MQYAIGQRRKIYLTALFSAFFVWSGWALADDSARLTEFNALAAERAEILVGVRKMDQRMSTAWRDPELTTAEIDVLRLDIQRLELELYTAQARLRRAVAEMPEMKQVRLDRDAAIDDASKLKKKLKALKPATPASGTGRVLKISVEPRD